MILDRPGVPDSCEGLIVALANPVDDFGPAAVVGERELLEQSLDHALGAFADLVSHQLSAGCGATGELDRGVTDNLLHDGFQPRDR